MKISNSEIVCSPSQEIGYYLNIQSSNSNSEDISLDECTTSTRSLSTTSTINREAEHRKKSITSPQHNSRGEF